MFASTLFRLNPNKRAALQEWGRLLMTDFRDEAIETLVEENVLSEAMYVIGDEYILAMQMLAGEIKPTNMERELNQKHRAIMRDAMTKIDGPMPQLSGAVTCIYFLAVPEQR